MSSFVLDCSVAVAWLLEGERIPEADALLDRLEGGGEAVVPGLWRLELGNVLAGAERRGRIGATGIARCLGLGFRLSVQVGAGESGGELVRLPLRPHPFSVTQRPVSLRPFSRHSVWNTPVFGSGNTRTRFRPHSPAP